MQVVIIDTLTLTLVAIESFIISLVLAAWLKGIKHLRYTPKWAELEGLNDEQIEELKKFLQKLRSGNDAAQTDT